MQRVWLQIYDPIARTGPLAGDRCEISDSNPLSGQRDVDEVASQSPNSLDKASSAWSLMELDRLSGRLERRLGFRPGRSTSSKRPMRCCSRSFSRFSLLFLDTTARRKTLVIDAVRPEAPLLAGPSRFRDLQFAEHEDQIPSVQRQETRGVVQVPFATPLLFYGARCSRSSTLELSRGRGISQLRAHTVFVAVV
jgi:hypothetical protein